MPSGYPSQHPPITVQWFIATDAKFTNVVNQGSITTSAARDYTVKVDADALQAGTRYYYQFQWEDQLSVIGTTKTLAASGLEHLRLACVSCANIVAGYFHAYQSIAQRDTLDAVLHLGDYLYEYGNDFVNGKLATLRATEPNHEIISLQDYRTRHAWYKRDIQLQSLHRKHPMIAIWDDHEFSNNAWREGAQNHQSHEGSWNDRRAAAMQAYSEWMPIREHWVDSTLQVFRQFQFGDLVNLTMLDTRIFGRDRQSPQFTQPNTNPDRSLLGMEQEQWLSAGLRTAQQLNVRWNIIAQQVMMSPLRLAPGIFANTDQWDGYPAARARLYTQIQQVQLDNVVVVTGDIHTSWAMDLAAQPFLADRYDPNTGSGSIAVEMVTPSVTSSGVDNRLLAQFLQAEIRRTHPHVHYVDLRRHGYLLLDINPDRIRGEWHYLSSIVQPDAVEYLGATTQVIHGSRHLSML